MICIRDYPTIIGLVVTLKSPLYSNLETNLSIAVFLACIIPCMCHPLTSLSLSIIILERGH
jgi:hypothetical protein